MSSLNVVLLIFGMKGSNQKIKYGVVPKGGGSTVNWGQAKTVINESLETFQKSAGQLSKNKLAYDGPSVNYKSSTQKPLEPTKNQIEVRKYYPGSDPKNSASGSTSGKNKNLSGKGTSQAVFENGRASIESFKSNPKAFSGKSAEEIAKMLEDVGYEVTVQASKKSRSGAKIIKIQNTGGEKNITQMQVSPGGGRHGESPYVKLSTSDQGIIKIVDGSEKAYKTDGAETATIIFTGRE